MESTLTFRSLRTSLLKAAAIGALVSAVGAAVATACGPDDGIPVEPFEAEAYNTKHVMKTGMTGALVFCLFSDCRVQADVTYETRSGTPIAVPPFGPDVAVVSVEPSPKLVRSGNWHRPNVIGDGVPIRAGEPRVLPIRVEKDSPELREAAKAGRVFARVRISLKPTKESWRKVRAVRGWTSYPSPVRFLDEPAVTDTFRVPLDR